MALKTQLHSFSLNQITISNLSFLEILQLAKKLGCKGIELRNDLGKVCKVGSIDVPQLFALESYAKVHHLISVVNGCLEKNKTWVDLLEASWPGGSITGAPKLRACQRLFELEPIARGPYCGSLLHRDWNGVLDSNIIIRSLILKGNHLRANAGCGIVADSDPKIEFEELNWKIMPLLRAME